MALTRLYTVPEVAEALHVTEAAIRRWISEGRLTVMEVGDAVRIGEAEFTRLIEAGRQPRWPSRRGPRSPAPSGVIASRSKRRELKAVPELVDEIVETPIDVDAVHELMAHLMLQAHRARTV
jgi:excisionase family DNA binding protein